jgi:hypothetical protein
MGLLKLDNIYWLLMVMTLLSFSKFLFGCKLFCLVMWGQVHVVLKLEWARTFYELGFDSPSSTWLLQACMQTTKFSLHFIATWDKFFWQLFTFNNHKTSHVETFVTTMLHWSKSNTPSNLNIEKIFSFLNIQHFKRFQINCYENTQIMIIISREKYSLCNQLDTFAPKTEKVTLAYEQHNF